ncbi:MAG: bifunctional 4-hydroxy-2-oxoglutarate aldolase/2-dehydro-3-deoxy-phosphogluconate aldolase, partial [Chloroflexaceae bacterium]|nr:bifunctional 4-hydroxy-2-oxoglutarate aldolase/2-dehydro-3-deoxy-phosphogluconate aldolase [Chloroflexaceae bacterium]
MVSIANPATAYWHALLQQQRAIAVIRSPDLDLGLAMARAIATGGIRLIEIAWNSHQPTHLVEQLRAELPNCYIGAGTILTPQHLDGAIAAGSQFLFSPHTSPVLIAKAIAAAVPMIPGALTPTEIVTAWQGGASCVKVFPVQAVGGPNYIKSLQGPLGSIPLIPTGGVTLENASQFLAAGAIAVGL